MYEVESHLGRWEIEGERRERGRGTNRGGEKGSLKQLPKIYFAAFLAAGFLAAFFAAGFLAAFLAGDLVAFFALGF